MCERLPFEILSQPNATACGPTCLHAVYRYYKDEISLDQVVGEVRALDEGGTLAVFLACHALQRGYDATIFTYNLQVFDPTWFDSGPVNVRARLLAQAQHKDDARLRAATEGYLRFLELGGRLRFEDLTSGLIRKYLTRSRPILTGLSATYLYREKREPAEGGPDDVRGYPQGHFVVLCGYDRSTRQVRVADPQHPNPLSPRRLYDVGIERVLQSILLGIITYDANLLILAPRGDDQGPSRDESRRRGQPKELAPGHPGGTGGVRPGVPDGTAVQ